METNVENTKVEFMFKVLEGLISLVAYVFLVTDSGGVDSNIAREAILYVIPNFLEALKSLMDWGNNTKTEIILDISCLVSATIVVVLGIVGCTNIWAYALLLPLYYIRCIAYSVFIGKSIPRQNS